MTAIIELRDVSRTYPGAAPVEAVKAATLSISSGDYVSIVGPSGSGKSTLLSILGCLDQATDGTYRLDGRDVASLSDVDRTSLRGSRVGFVFQSFHLLSHRTVIENVESGMIYQRISRHDRRRLAREALERVQLSRRSSFLPPQLSGGERQRVAIARAIAPSPAVLLCDEPTGNLDTVTTRALLDLFDTLHNGGQTLVVITHNEEVATRANRRLEIVDGHVTECIDE